MMRTSILLFIRFDETSIIHIPIPLVENAMFPYDDLNLACISQLNKE